ncbi:hypothetical protein [Litorivivens sp.]|uniref:hypothetical protein n=1 Tax=Litorivivens sp. TaxID=2020868 RepID=UPI0035645E27
MKKWIALCIAGCLGVVSCSSNPEQQSAVLTQTVLVNSWQQSNSDTHFNQPYIDVDEWRSEPVRHRYIHGGFTGTDTRFSLYFPPAAQYEGRFFQYITPVPDSETLSQGSSGADDKIGFSIASGAYFIETNGGGRNATAMPGSGIDPTIGAYRANAAVAQFSRVIAQALYQSGRPYGYAFGGSGGGYRTIGGMENTHGVWDGAVPFVIGSPMAIPNVFTVRMYAMRVLGDTLAQIADAVDVGGGDPYAGLSDEQRRAFDEVTNMGFPLQAWPVYPSLGLHGFAVLYPGILAADPGYFQDFWTKPGYEGYRAPASLLNARVQHKTSVKALLSVKEVQDLLAEHQPGTAKNLADTAWKSLQDNRAVALQLAAVPAKSSLGLDMQVLSGPASGQYVPAIQLKGDIVVLGFGREKLVEQMQAGDEILLDNGNFLAAQTYHRHQVPGDEYPAWDQFRDTDGKPRYPQRPMILGPHFTMAAAGTVPQGKFGGKMILVENLFDTEAYPWQGDWYRQRVVEHLGENTDQQFRLWFTDRANHNDHSKQAYPRHTVSYIGVLQQALRDVSAWVEQGIAPARTTRYSIRNGQVIVPDNADQRHGIQPTIGLNANGGERAVISAGDDVALIATVDVPSGAGTLVSAAWDLDGSGQYAIPAEIANPDDGPTVVSLIHRYTEPGTHFAVLRVASQREGDSETPFARIYNLARVRIVVR